MRFFELLAAARRGGAPSPTRRAIKPAWLIIGVAAAASLCMWTAGQPTGPTGDAVGVTPPPSALADDLSFRAASPSTELPPGKAPIADEGADRLGLRPLSPTQEHPGSDAGSWRELAGMDSGDTLPSPPPRERVSLASIIAKAVVILILVWAGGRALKLYYKRRRPAGESSDSEGLRVTERACLGGDRNLYVVEAAGQRMLIAVDPTGTSLLAPLDRPSLTRLRNGDGDLLDDRDSASAADAAEESARRRAAKRRLVADALAQRAREARGNGSTP